ncbi:transporter substrate-binding domain-containing protein [Pararhizobium sp. YC-54]|uniref:transporter substrate-binding domain-containing protein n=1 Tax=Pararhizobium sp. YC-54 TaxID=2986920 RepID=UPI0021F76696|nr:transporter substrate-binding domain-containing protein [Pararhizobium sp. YC-54]MCW0001869.1 transporter substrate-binding domain-containing protein [Pararhizobium sp. YC-54]
MGRQSLMVGLSVAIAMAASAQVSAADLESKAKTDGLTYAIINAKPWYYNDDQGTLTGADVENLRAALAAMGIDKFNPTVTEWSSIVPGVKSGRFDIGAGMYITPERCKEVAFTMPYAVIIPALVVKKGNPDGVKSWEDLKNKPELKAGAYAGGAEVGYMVKSGVANENIVQLPDQNSLVQALVNSQISAFNVGAGQAAEIVAQVEGLEVVKEFNPPEWSFSYNGWPFAKANADFVAKLNEQIRKRVESGEAEATNQKFGVKGADLRPFLKKVNINDICSR